jgi:hypothetical protein
MSHGTRAFVIVLVGGFVAALGSCGGGDDGTPPRDCTPGEMRSLPESCGPCELGDATETCSADGTWQLTSCTDNPIDLDGDTFPNEDCEDLPGGCCMEQLDCNDRSADVHPELYPCMAFRTETGGPDMGDCTSSCGGAGRRTCSDTCMWNECNVPMDICNGADDDCDTLIDEDMPCVPGEIVTCITTCGSQGSAACTDDCVAPPPASPTCTPPAEACNGRDDDCDTVVDNGC